MKIYSALDDEATTLDQLALLYAQANGSPFNTYRRIDWYAIQGAIESARGKQGLDYVVLESRRKQ